METMMNIIRSGLCSKFPANIVKKLLEAYTETKRNYYLGGLRLSEVEGGRFCEAAFRMLEHKTTGLFTPFSKKLNTDRLIAQLAFLSKTSFQESVRLHIPRALRVVYDIRNNRDAAHLADGIDPNKQDATLVIAVLDWILAEFIRLEHSVSAKEAQLIVENLVERRSPAIQDFDGFLKVLKPNLSARDYILLLLYQCGKKRAFFTDLERWSRPKMKRNLRRTLYRLVDEYAFVHFDGKKYIISELGMKEVERKKIYEVQ